MKVRTPDAVAFGKCPSHCPNFATCLEVASAVVSLEYAVDADLAAPVEADPTQPLAVYEDRLLMASAAALAFPAPERGCPRYIPPVSGV